ncbi:uncharacterized protein METZ01_LOCUS312235, partial [marine metagenome]
AARQRVNTGITFEGRTNRAGQGDIIINTTARQRNGAARQRRNRQITIGKTQRLDTGNRIHAKRVTGAHIGNRQRPIRRDRKGEVTLVAGKHNRIRPRTAFNVIVAGATGDRVGTGTTVYNIGTVSTEYGVIAFAAIYDVAAETAIYGVGAKVAIDNIGTVSTEYGVVAFAAIYGVVAETAIYDVAAEAAIYGIVAKVAIDNIGTVSTEQEIVTFAAVNVISAIGTLNRNRNTAHNLDIVRTARARQHKSVSILGYGDVPVVEAERLNFRNRIRIARRHIRDRHRQAVRGRFECVAGLIAGKYRNVAAGATRDRVGAGSTRNGVGTIPTIDRVGTGAAVYGVVAETAIYGVVAKVAIDNIGTVSTEQEVV